VIPHVYGSQKLLVMMQSSDSSSGTDCVCPVGMARAGLDFPGPGMGWTTREYARAHGLCMSTLRKVGLLPFGLLPAGLQQVSGFKAELSSLRWRHAAGDVADGRTDTADAAADVAGGDVGGDAGGRGGVPLLRSA